MKLNVFQNIPAGIMDEGVEFFVHGTNVHALYNGQRVEIHELPEWVKLRLLEEISHDKGAEHALDGMGLLQDNERIAQYVYCRYGGFNNEADISQGGESVPDYWECPLRGLCKYEGKLCTAIKVKHGHLTKREIEVIKLIADDKMDKEIADLLEISYQTVTSHKQHIKDKLGVETKLAIAMWAKENNVV